MRLNRELRYQIKALLDARLFQKDVARQLGITPGALSKELNKNGGRDGFTVSAEDRKMNKIKQQLWGFEREREPRLDDGGRANELRGDSRRKKEGGCGLVPPRMHSTEQVTPLLPILVSGACEFRFPLRGGDRPSELGGCGPWKARNARCDGRICGGFGLAFLLWVEMWDSSSWAAHFPFLYFPI